MLKTTKSTSKTCSHSISKHLDAILEQTTTSSVRSDSPKEFDSSSIAYLLKHANATNINEYEALESNRVQA